MYSFLFFVLDLHSHKLVIAWLWLLVLGHWVLCCLCLAAHNLRLSPMEKMGLQVVPPVKGSLAHTLHFGEHCLESLDSHLEEGRLQATLIPTIPPPWTSSSERPSLEPCCLKNTRFECACRYQWTWDSSFIHCPCKWSKADHICMSPYPTTHT